MDQPRTLRSTLFCISLVLVLTCGFSTSCSQPAARPTGPAGDYQAAQGYFEKGNLNRALDHTDKLAKGSPANEFTDRARVLRVVIYAGQMEGFKELSDAYAKGADTTKNADAKSLDGNQRHDTLMVGGQKALYLAGVAHQLTEGGALPKDLSLDAPYPASEGPTVVAQLNRVMDGVLIGPDDVDAAATDAQRKGIDDTLGEVVGGDRTKARNALQAGPVKLDDYTFAMFLSKKLLHGADLFDRKHLHDPDRLKTVCGVADETAKAALAALKDTPDKAKEKEVKKLQDDIKSTLKKG